MDKFIWLVDHRKNIKVHGEDGDWSIEGDFTTISSLDENDHLTPIGFVLENENQLANAALMAAAPNMFNALIEISKLIQEQREINKNEINQIIGLACEKVWAESGG